MKAYEEIHTAYILGSLVGSEYYHDIDVAVLLREDFNKNNFNKYPFGYESFFNVELESLVRNKIDFVVMNQAEITLQQRIVNNSIILFSRNKFERIQYENMIRELFIDSEDIRKIKRKYLIEKLRNV